MLRRSWPAIASAAFVVAVVSAAVLAGSVSTDSGRWFLAGTALVLVTVVVLLLWLMVRLGRAESAHRGWRE
jgi:membrane protein YdbS with pleckstrin-like domain